MKSMTDKTFSLPQLISIAKFTTEFSTLGDDYVFTRITEANRMPVMSEGPVRFDGMSWMLCFSGSIDVEINLVPTSLRANSIAVTRAGSFVEIKDVQWDNLDCYMLFVSRDFIRDINFDINILSSLPPVASKGVQYKPVIDITPAEANLLRNYYEILNHNTLSGDTTFSKAIARSIIAALTYQLIQIVARSIPADAGERPKSRRSGYISDFFQLVHENHRRERSVAFYADKLFISPKYLSLIIKEATGRSAADIIDDYVILEAKNLLRFSGKNIQQVSYELNFPNQSSFGKYFKHLVGMSPLPNISAQSETPVSGCRRRLNHARRRFVFVFMKVLSAIIILLMLLGAAPQASALDAAGPAESDTTGLTTRPVTSEGILRPAAAFGGRTHVWLRPCRPLCLSSRFQGQQPPRGFRPRHRLSALRACGSPR